MATDHRGNPINENNRPKTNQDRIFEGSNFGPKPEGSPSDWEYLDAEAYFAEKSEYPDEPDDDGLGDTRSAELSEQHDKEDKAGLEATSRGDHSELLPSQHQTGRGYGY